MLIPEALQYLEIWDRKEGKERDKKGQTADLENNSGECGVAEGKLFFTKL